MGTADLRRETGINDRKVFSKAIDELQAAMIVIPSDVLYQAQFTYIWTLSEARFPDLLISKMNKVIALEEIAKCFLANAGMTIPGELAITTGLSRPDSGIGNQQLVKKRLNGLMLANICI